MEHDLTPETYRSGSGPLKLERLAVVVGLALCVVPFYLSAVPLMSDVSQHVLVARILNQLHNPILGYGEYFSVHWQVAPGIAFYPLFAALQRLVGPFWDARLYLSFWVVGTWFSVRWLAKVGGHPAPWLPALVSLPLAFCWFAYKGFLPFLGTLPLFAVILAIWLGRWKPYLRIAATGILLVLTFGFHIVGAAAAAAALWVAAALQIRKQPRELVHAALATLPLVVLTLLYASADTPPVPRPSSFHLRDNVLDSIKFTAASLSDGAVVLMLVWLLTLAVLGLVHWRHVVRQTSTAVAAAVLLAIAVAMPSSLGALWPAGPRLVPFALLLFIVSIPWIRLPRILATGFPLVVLAALSGFTSRHLMKLDPEIRDFLSGLPAVRPGSRILPVIGYPSEGSRWVEPYWMLGSAYTVYRGGMNPYVLAVPHVQTGATPLRYLGPPSLRGYAYLYDPPRGPEHYRGVGARYDYVLLWHDSASVAAVLRDELVEVFHQGKLRLFARPELARKPGG